MKSSLFALVMMGAPALALSAEEWRTYTNDKYGYEIQYPDSYETWFTGTENERDGRTVRIALKDTTFVHGIDIKIHPGMSLEQILSETNSPKLSEIESADVTTVTKYHKITWKQIMVNDAPAVKLQARYVENDGVFLTSLLMDQVAFTAHLSPAAGLDEPLAKRIVSTFRWKIETDNEPDASDVE